MSIRGNAAQENKPRRHFGKKKSSSGTDPVRRAAHAALLEFHRAPCNADELLARFSSKEFDFRDRAFLRELIYGVLRWRNRLDAAYGRFLREPPGRLSQRVRESLRLGTYQILFLDRVPDYGAVNTSVELAGRPSERWARGLVNAVLRNVSRESLGPSDDIEERLVVWDSHPRWIVRRWIDSLGPETTRARCEANNAEGPVVFRVNTEKADCRSLTERFRQEGIRVEMGRVDPDCLRLVPSSADKQISFTEIPSYKEGLFIAQDESSSLVARFAGARVGDRVLDACAAPGGKTVVMAWSAGHQGLIVAADTAKNRLGRLRTNCARIQVPVRILAMSAGNPAFRDVFDVVLVDAPCSGLGVLRRHPDARWRLQEEDVIRHGRLQRELLSSAAQTVRPGGHLTYAVCSNEREETDQVAQVMENCGFVLDPGTEFLPDSAKGFVGKDGALRIRPEDGQGLDGFFAVRWRRCVERK